MKKLFLLSLLNMLLLSIIAQVPQGINYQAVARRADGSVLVNTHISFRFTVMDGVNPGTPDYTETDTATTNAFGLFTHVIGQGNPASGSFAAIIWSTGNKYLLVELDAAGGTNYINMGAAQLVSVPYALYALTAGNGVGGSTGPTGLAGAAGPTGLTGATGVQGDAGVTGAAGATGAQGITGATGLLQAGSAAGNTPYWNGAQWITNSSNIYNNGGNIGIGTATPAYITDINGTLGPRIRVYSKDNDFAGLLTQNSTRQYFIGIEATYESPGGTSSGFEIYDNTAGARRLVIDTTGNTGIGTDAPHNRLDVAGSIAVGSYAGNNTASDANSIIVPGNVGIGTASPTVKLDIENGNSSPAFKLADGTQAAGNVLTSDASGNAKWAAPATYSKPVSLRGSIASFSSDSLVFTLPNDSVNVYYSPLSGLVTVYNVTGSYYYDVCITGVQNGSQLTPLASTGSPAAGQWTTLALGAGGANGNYGVSVVANHEGGAHGFVLNFTIFEDGINCLIGGIVQYY